jgi:branched-chain amino acid transport system substrate-binding protein
MRPTVLIELRPIAPPFDITIRELEVVTLIAAGFGNDAIAAHLDIGRRTTGEIEGDGMAAEIGLQADLGREAAARGSIRPFCKKPL